MIGAMPPVASEHAQRSRLAPWVIAAAVVPVISFAVLAIFVWFVIPPVRPSSIWTYSPWAAPVVRMGVVQEGRLPGTGALSIIEWARESGERCDRLIPYLGSTDRQTRLVVVGALEGLTGLQKPRPIDGALIPLLSDPDPLIRAYAAGAMMEPSSIPALEAHGIDPIPEVAAAIDLVLERLRGPRPTLVTKP